MSEINVGDKVRLKKDIFHTTTFKKNDEIYKTSQITWKAGSIHTVKHIDSGYVSLNDVDIIVKVCNVEKVEEFYTGMVVCTKWSYKSRDIFTVGKVYEIKNGNIQCNDMTKLPKIKNLDELNRHPDVEFVEIKNPEELKKDRYYNGKIVCIDLYKFPNRFTKGKIYEVVDGQFVADDGCTVPAYGYFFDVKDIEKWATTCKFIEVVE